MVDLLTDVEYDDDSYDKEQRDKEGQDELLYDVLIYPLQYRFHILQSRADFFYRGFFPRGEISRLYMGPGLTHKVEIESEIML